MKKLMFIFICLAVFGTATVNAQISQKEKDLIANKIEEGFTKLDTASLPESIKKDIEKDFSEAELHNAYVNEKRRYMLVFITDETKSSQVVYANTKRGILNK